MIFRELLFIGNTSKSQVYFVDIFRNLLFILWKPVDRRRLDEQRWRRISWRDEGHTRWGVHLSFAFVTFRISHVPFWSVSMRCVFYQSQAPLFIAAFFCFFFCNCCLQKFELFELPRSTTQKQVCSYSASSRQKQECQCLSFELVTTHSWTKKKEKEILTHGAIVDLCANMSHKEDPAQCN